MIVNKVSKVSEMSLLDIVKYQIVTHCYFEKIMISDAAAQCFAHLCLTGTVDLNQFCIMMHDNKLFASPQSVRNTITKGEERNLIVKDGNYRKEISINPALDIQTEGNVFLNFNFLCRATT